MSNKPKKIPITIDRARTIIVNLVVSCLEGHVTFLSSPITSDKKLIGAKPLPESFGGCVANYYLFSLKVFLSLQDGQNFLSSSLPSVFLLFFSV